MGVGDIQEVPHSPQSVAVRRELIFYALVVANVGEDGAENAHFRSVVARDKQPTLDHHLKQPNGFHCDTLSTCIGPADDQHALLAMKFDVLRQRFLAGQFVGELKEGVEGRQKMKTRLFSDLW